MLATPWANRKNAYDIVIIGSGYGGSITAARLATANLNPRRSICLLERGREWTVGDFPDDSAGVVSATRSDLNPLGLYELLNYPDISVIKGSGLGGTSLINANVAIVPDAEVFDSNWPSTITRDSLKTYYGRARSVLASTPHPRAMQLAKVQALKRRADELGLPLTALDINVNFTIDGTNPYGVPQKPCVDCGNCVTGCNVGAKNTLAMNYLPMAASAGVIIHTQTKVEWLEKLPSGDWRIHGKHVEDDFSAQSFTIDAHDVILSAGSLNSTEILLRSEMHGLPVSPALGTRFNGNADFFGLSYNGDGETDVLGYVPPPNPGPGDAPAPGPNIVGLIRYTAGLPESQRISVEDFSFPSASIQASKALFGLIRGQDTVTGNEQAQADRLARDLDPFDPLHNPNGALNHSMLYLVMGQDNARGVVLFEAPWTEPDGRIRISWDKAGQQQIFTRMNEEIRRHARALRANFISNPTWSFFQLGHLITAHPLGGCPMGEDHLQGAVDPFHRVYTADGSTHSGLYVTDGAVVPSALGVNPFLTISALAERFAERKIQQLQGNAYPVASAAVSMNAIDAMEVSTWSEAQLETLFRRCPTMDISAMVNHGGDPMIDVTNQVIHNDRYWKGFFPQGHVLNAMSSALFTGFKKEFHGTPGRYTGITSDTDDRIHARNSLEMIDADHDGSLEPGRYILLRYLDPPWQGFYDVFKMINDELLIGRVYLGQYPNGARLFTFPMTRRYRFGQMTMADHAALYASGAAPTVTELEGVWRMDVISNANHAAGIAYLQFVTKPDGTFEARYDLLGLFEGLVIPSFLKDHFQLNDFSVFHDEIRVVSPDFLVGKYVTGVPPVAASLLGGPSLGLLHAGADGQFGVSYMLTRMADAQLPTNTLLKPLLDAQLPDGVGLTFEETMTGWYFPGQPTPQPGRDGDLTISGRIPSSGDPQGAVPCSFQAHISVADVNEFIDGYQHEAQIDGTISFGALEGDSPAGYAIDGANSRFHYLRLNPQTGRAQMVYHIEFLTPSGKRYSLDALKYMQRDGGGGFRNLGDILEDFTTAYGHLTNPSGETGTAYLKFRTFEDLAATANLAGFLASFSVTGASDPVTQLQARLRFVAFTMQFTQREYDPLGFGAGQLASEVRAEVLRGAATPDYFTTRPASELQAILHDTPSRTLDELLNTHTVRINFDDQRIFRDSFWKGSFAEDSLLGWEQKVRAALPGNSSESVARTFAGGSFWKRFDHIADGVATGFVVNYELSGLPGIPQVREIEYPDDNRRYFRKGDRVLLLTYTNDPYKTVYDTIKIIDSQNAIGVMHLGEFPNGLEFATFVMSRNNYPFENMTIEDHDAIFSDIRATVPAPDQLQGAWNGRVVMVPSAEDTLRNQFSPILFQAIFDGGALRFSASFPDPAAQPDFRFAGANLLLGTCASGIRIILTRA